MIQLTNREWEREISSREDQQVWAMEDGGRVLDEGLTPSVGCWYYNTASYLTLTSAGYLPVTRIFCVEL